MADDSELGRIAKLSTQLPPYFIDQYERLLAVIGIKPPHPYQHTPRQFLELYAAAATKLSPQQAINYTNTILTRLGWTEYSADTSLAEFVVQDLPQIDPRISEQLDRLNCSNIKVSIMNAIDRIVNQLENFHCDRYYLAVSVLNERPQTRYSRDTPFLELYEKVRQMLIRHSLAAAFTCSVLERAGWRDTGMLRRYSAADFHLERQYPMVDLCLTVADYFSNMRERDYRNARMLISAVHLGGQSVDRMDLIEFVLRLKERDVIRPGDVSKIEDTERFPIFFSNYKTKYSKLFPSNGSLPQEMAVPETETYDGQNGRSTSELSGQPVSASAPQMAQDDVERDTGAGSHFLVYRNQSQQPGNRSETVPSAAATTGPGANISTPSMSISHQIYQTPVTAEDTGNRSQARCENTDQQRERDINLIMGKKPELPDLMKTLKTIKKRSLALSDLLGVDRPNPVNHSDELANLGTVLREWLDKRGAAATWSSLLDALTGLECQNVIDEIKRFLQDETIFVKYRNQL